MATSRTITILSIPVGAKMQLTLIRSKRKVIKVDTTAARGRMKRIGATATMNIVRKKGNGLNDLQRGNGRNLFDKL